MRVQRFSFSKLGSHRSVSFFSIRETAFSVREEVCVVLPVFNSIALLSRRIIINSSFILLHEAEGNRRHLADGHSQKLLLVLRRQVVMYRNYSLRGEQVNHLTLDLGSLALSYDLPNSLYLGHLHIAILHGSCRFVNCMTL